jgi:hypothetical protein
VPSDLLLLENAQGKQIKKKYFGSLAVCRFNETPPSIENPSPVVK